MLKHWKYSMVAYGPAGREDMTVPYDNIMDDPVVLDDYLSRIKPLIVKDGYIPVHFIDVELTESKNIEFNWWVK